MDGYKLLVTFNVSPQREMEYRRFMIQRWIPAMQRMGLEPGDVLHTMWGDYAVRMVVLYAKDLETITRTLTSDGWKRWCERLTERVEDCEYRVVRARPWLQF